MKKRNNLKLLSRVGTNFGAGVEYIIFYREIKRLRKQFPYLTNFTLKVKYSCIEIWAEYKKDALSDEDEPDGIGGEQK